MNQNPNHFEFWLWRIIFSHITNNFYIPIYVYMYVYFYCRRWDGVSGWRNWCSAVSRLVEEPRKALIFIMLNINCLEISLTKFANYKNKQVTFILLDTCYFTLIEPNYWFKILNFSSQLVLLPTSYIQTNNLRVSTIFQMFNILICQTSLLISTNLTCLIHNL